MEKLYEILRGMHPDVDFEFINFGISGNRTSQLFDRLSVDMKNVSAIGVSTRPRNVEGSYMPVFLAGVSSATSCACASGAKLYKTSHQVGHILAALYSIDKLDLIKREFIAFQLFFHLFSQ